MSLTALLLEEKKKAKQTKKHKSYLTFSEKKKCCRRYFFLFSFLTQSINNKPSLRGIKGSFYEDSGALMKTCFATCFMNNISSLPTISGNFSEVWNHPPLLKAGKKLNSILNFFLLSKKIFLFH